MKKASMIRSKSLFAAASLALLLLAGNAQASFNYSVTATPSPVSFGAGNTSTYTTTPSFTSGSPSGTLGGNQSINLVQTTQSSTRNPGTDTTSFQLTIVTTINNLNGGGSSTITLVGTLAVQRSDTTGAQSTFTQTSISPSSITLGGFVYTLSSPTYTAPTIGSTPANGGISINITENAVPEPASLVMMGTSALVLGGLTVIRRRRQA